MANKTHPFISYIENIFTNIDFDYVKKTEMGLYPVEIMDDTNSFVSNSFQSFKDSSNASSLTNGTVFKFFRRSDFSERVWDRTISPLKSQKILSLGKMLFRINPSTDVYLREYEKFTTFFAGVSAILSNSLLVFVIVIGEVNRINGKNSLLKYIFSNDAIKNILKFNKDFNIMIKKKACKGNIRNSDKNEIGDKIESKLIINKEFQLKELKNSPKNSLCSVSPIKDFNVIIIYFRLLNSKII